MATIYALRCPLRKEIRYIGKANDAEDRLRKHLRIALCSKEKTHRLAWLRQLLRNKTAPELVVLHKIRRGFDWRAMERFFIASALHFEFPLTNGTLGGEGFVPFGKGAKNHKLAMKRFWADPVLRAKNILAAHSGEATRKRINASRDPKNVAARKAALGSAKTREKMSATRTRLHQDPKFTQRMLDAKRTPSAHKRYRAAALRRDDEYYAKHLAGVKRSWEQRKSRSQPDAIARFPELSWVYGIAA